MSVSHILYKNSKSSKAHRSEYGSVIGDEHSMGVSSTGSDQKQQNISVRISLFWSPRAAEGR